MGAPVRLRTDFSAGALRQLAKRAEDADQTRRLLALAAVLDGMSRKAAAEIGAMDRQTLRDWAHRFNDEAKSLMTGAPHDIVGLRQHRDFGDAVPTADHFLPLLYIAGLAAAADSTADVLVDGYAYGSLSMTAYTVGG